MKTIGFIKCLLVGHELEDKSIIPFIDSNNYLKKCKCCGFYIAHGDIGSVLVGKRQAIKWCREFNVLFGGETE